MDDFGINEMKEMQRTLQDKYKHKWEPIDSTHLPRNRTEQAVMDGR